jgi:hypothetical protein
MFFWNKICVIATFFFTSLTSLQAQLSSATNQKDFINKKSIQTAGYGLTVIPQQTIRFQNAQFLSNSIKVIPGDFCTQRFGFFCKQELIIEKATKLPLRFRIGSLRECNYYEGKLTNHLNY